MMCDAARWRFNPTAGSMPIIGAYRDLREFRFGDFAPENGLRMSANCQFILLDKRISIRYQSLGIRENGAGRAIPEAVWRPLNAQRVRSAGVVPVQLSTLQRPPAGATLSTRVVDPAIYCRPPAEL